MAGRLAGKRCFITGGASGIGAASVQLFTAEGAAVHFCDVKADRGRAVAAAAGPAATFLEVDITDETALKTAIDGAAAAMGGLDGLYNNAGGATSRDGKVTEIPIDEFWRTISVDLFGAFLACRFAIPHLAASGQAAIVNTTSIRAMKGTQGADAYTSAKGGVLTLTRALAQQCLPMGIRVNAIAPGDVLTERTSGFGMSFEQSFSDPRRPTRVGRPEEIAQVALFLISDDASLVNGAIVPADSGSSAY